jgi:multiple sugar transport system ATP-binding protein
MANLALQGVSLSSVGSAPSPELSLEIRDKELVALCGPAGSGKTALLRAISGLDEIAKGDILIEGKKAPMALKEREVAMVFADGALYPRMTVEENLAFGLKVRRVPAAEMTRRIGEAASILGIEALLAKRADANAGLTPLDLKRVALGRAMVGQPKVYLLDSPFAGLDSTSKTQLQAELVRIHERLQATMLFATADPSEALAVADRIVCLKSGQIQQTASPAEIYQQPANLFVAGFFGNPGMNLIRGKLKDAGEQLQFREQGEGSIQCLLPTQVAGKGLAGKEVILGIRPEQIRPMLAEIPNSPSASRGSGALIKGLVDLIEARGAETLVHFQTGEHFLSSRSPEPIERSEHIGRRMQFELDLSKALLFDPDTTQRIEIVPVHSVQ